MKQILYVTFLLLILGCKKSPSTENYPDGKYCAEIEYNNPKTGEQTTYTLPVEVEKGRLIKIEFSNGGWLDDSHFSPPDITDGIASFKDDRRRAYEVTLINDENCN